ncbi:MAG: hypothetical protein K6L75_14635 [Cellvibrionaceae bacterium]
MDSQKLIFNRAIKQHNKVLSFGGKYTTGKMQQKISRKLGISVQSALLLITAQAQSQSAAGPKTNIQKQRVDEVVVWGSESANNQLANTNPISVLTHEDITSINIATTEDIVKYEPSIVIRRRFIGDSNGTLGIRGSNMFQTSRSILKSSRMTLIRASKEILTLECQNGDQIY